MADMCIFQSRNTVTQMILLFNIINIEFSSFAHTMADVLNQRVALHECCARISI